MGSSEDSTFLVPSGLLGLHPFWEAQNLHLLVLLIGFITLPLNEKYGGFYGAQMTVPLVDLYLRCQTCKAIIKLSTPTRIAKTENV